MTVDGRFPVRRGAIPPVRDDLRQLTGYHSPQVDVPIRLNTNESPVAPPQAFLDAMADTASSIQWHRYPDRGAVALREAIAAQHHADTPTPGAVSHENVFAANGSNEVLQTLMLGWGGPDRTVVTFEPTYALHRHIANIVGTRAVSGERDSSFVLDAAHARNVIATERPTITFLCSPNNPTGIVESRELVDAVLDAVIDVGGMLVVDEAYAEFSPWTAIELLDEESPLVVTRTFSKTWAMASARLGYLVGPASIVERLYGVVLPYHLDSMKQAAGVAALGFVDEMQDRITMIVAERERLSSDLRRLGVEVWDSGSNFVLFRPPVDAVDGRGGAGVWQELLDRGVLVRNCATWERLDGTLRVTIGSPEENRSFVAALGEILGDR